MVNEKLPTAIFAEWVSAAVAEADIDQKRSEFWNDSAKIQSFAPAPPKLWKAMHNPEWEEHGDEDEFFRKGNYTFAICKGTTPISLISSISVGDQIVVQPRTMIGKNNRVLQNAKNLPKMRYGTITTKPALEPKQKDRREHPLYFVNVDWEEKVYPNNPNIKNSPCKTFTLIH